MTSKPLYSPSPEETLDTLLRGRLKLLQPRRGARVSQDALVLANFAVRPRLGKVLDLGCGGGVITLVLATSDPNASFVGVEVQPSLAALARRNTLLNEVAERVRIVEGDLRSHESLPLERGSFQLAVSNPPFFTVGPGRMRRVAPREDRALSRHELGCTVDDVVRAARRFLRPLGRLAMVFPADRLPDLFSALAAAQLVPRVLRPVHSVADEPARRVLVEAVLGYRGGLSVLPPLVVHERDRRRFTAEMSKILGEEGRPSARGGSR